MGRTAIVNGFGRTLGDSIIGLQALTIAQAHGLIDPHPLLFRLPGLSPIIEEVYAAANDRAEIGLLPWDDATRERAFAPAAAFTRAIDMRDFAFDPAFRGTAMIDYFLRCLACDPVAIPAAERRNTWMAPRVTPTGPTGHVLVCPRTASDLRTMPPTVHAHILDWLARHCDTEILTQDRLPPAGSLADLCGLVAGARLVISADTAMVHLADAFDVPCLTFFTSHRPEWRVRDYPKCRAIFLAPAGLPEALEFVRDAADVAACQAAWLMDGGLGWLDPLLATAWNDARTGNGT